MPDSDDNSETTPATESVPSEETDSKTKYKCDECSKEFNSPYSLNVHSRSIHNGEKPYTCDKCERTFSYSNSLKIHMLSHLNVENENQKPQYPCDMCDKVMNHPSGLAYHKATKHNNGKWNCRANFYLTFLSNFSLLFSIFSPYTIHILCTSILKFFLERIRKSGIQIMKKF